MRVLAAFLIFLSCSAFSEDSEEAKFCEMAHHLVKEEVYLNWGAGVRIEEASIACEVDGDGDVKKVRWAYTTVISRRNGSPPVKYEVTIKRFGADTYRLCSWRNPIDTPKETLGAC